MNELVIQYNPQIRQIAFHECSADEVLYGGAAGGGKSEAILFDALGNAMYYENCKIIVFRRTFPDLKRSLIQRSLESFPKELGKYNQSDKKWVFINGSTIEFAYWDDDSNYMNYQGAEYDFIYWDELTQFKQEWYVYMLSRLRGSKVIPRQVKSATNPGGVGHHWVRERFIEGVIPEVIQRFELTDAERYAGVKRSLTRCFIPASVYDNRALLDKDPQYLARLMNLPEKDRRALLEGDWDIFDGQYFNEFRKSIHVVEPFVLPEHWQRFRVMDYGLDMLAHYWIAIDTQGFAFVYKELYESNLIISDAANKIKELTIEKIKLTYAPPDLWNRRQETGKSAADIFQENGINLMKATSDRIDGWLNLKEWLKPFDTIDEQTGDTVKTARLKVFSNCVNLIRTLPLLQHDEKDPNDVATEPHEITHAPDSIRYFFTMRTLPSRPAPATKPLTPEQSRMARINEAAEKHLKEVTKRTKMMGRR